MRGNALLPLVIFSSASGPQDRIGGWLRCDVPLAPGEVKGKSAFDASETGIFLLGSFFFGWEPKKKYIAAEGGRTMERSCWLLAIGF